MEDRYSDDTSMASDDKFLPDAQVGMTQVLTEDNGVVKECLVEGEGTHRPGKGSEVTINFTGRLENGDVFEPTTEGLVFVLGNGQVRKGWDVGVATMRKGEKSILTCSPAYACDQEGLPSLVPPNVTVKYEIELVSWVDVKDISENTDGSIIKRIHKHSDKYDRPHYESVCKVTVTTLSGPESTACVEKASEPVTIGEDHITSALEKTLESMCVDEECEVTVRSDDGVHVYKVVLHEFTSPPSRWNLSFAEKLKEAEVRKLQGNAYYKAQRMTLAVQKYEKALEYLSDEHGASDDEKKASKAVKLPLLTNLAAVQLFLKNYSAVVERCTEALGIESGNAKALLRRAKANSALDNWHEARADLDKLLESSPTDAEEAAAELAKLKKKMKAQDAKEKQLFSNMFH